MSLTVPRYLTQKAREGQVTNPEFIACIQGSLPRAWAIVSNLAVRKQTGEPGLINHAPPSMDDTTRGELLRMMASSAIKHAVERHFGLMFAFQNCHVTAAFRVHEAQAYHDFTSAEAQILNQSPELVDC